MGIYVAGSAERWKKIGHMHTHSLYTYAHTNERMVPKATHTNAHIYIIQEKKKKGKKKKTDLPALCPGTRAHRILMIQGATW